MLAGHPAVPSELFFAKSIGFVFQRGRKGFIPPVEKAEKGNDSKDFLRILLNVSSVAAFGTEAPATARSRAARSASLKSGLV